MRSKATLSGSTTCRLEKFMMPSNSGVFKGILYECLLQHSSRDARTIDELTNAADDSGMAL